MSIAATDIACWLAVGLYVLAVVFLVAGVVTSRRRFASASLAVAAVGALANSACVVIAWTDAGTVDPASEGLRLTLAACAMALAYLLLAWRRSDLVAAGLLVLPLAATTLGVAAVTEDALHGVAFSGAGDWALLGASIATWTACALLGGLAVASLVPRTSRHALGLSARLAAFAFVASAVALVAGSVASYASTGSLYADSPGEVWMLFTLLGLALYMHSKLTLGWDRRSLAAVALVIALGAAMSLWQVRLPDDTLSFVHDVTVEMKEVS